MYKKISDYGVIGNFHTTALVGKDGSIDWLCLPHTDSPSIFAAILDVSRGGSFSLAPADVFDSTAWYETNTNVLVTLFRTRDGIFEVTDFMPVDSDMEHGISPHRHELYRIGRVKEGEVEIVVNCFPRFDFGRARSRWEESGTSTFIATAGSESFTLCCSRPGLAVAGDTLTGTWRLRKGEGIRIHLVYGKDENLVFDEAVAFRSLAATESYWREWLRSDETGERMDFGPFTDMIHRSALLLKLLEYTPSGAIAAAATTSLPERIGGVRNWDYRFSWVRDSALTIEAFFSLGHLKEMKSYFRWMEGILRRSGDKLHVLYGLRGQQELTETELTHLEGYKGSRPVRVGNLAEKQLQLDTYGEVMDAALRLSRYSGQMSEELWPALHAICERAARLWQEKDRGIWEMRGGPFHLVFSKVMSWVALDRGIRIAGRHGFPADFDRWRRTMDDIRTKVLTRGWSSHKGSFVQQFDGEELDASALLMPVYGFIPFDDPQMVSTVEAIRRELGSDGFLRRYRMDDGLPGEEGCFLVCTFWLVDNLVGQGKEVDAEYLLLRAEQAANHLGIFSEEYDPVWREQLGNIPQAFSHIGYINSVISLLRRKSERKSRP